MHHRQHGLVLEHFDNCFQKLLWQLELILSVLSRVSVRDFCVNLKDTRSSEILQ